jgi:sugar (pentulose or hexulose) kinase
MSATQPLIALFDIGKTNAKLSLLDADDGHEIWQERRPNQSCRGIYGAELDVTAIEQWLFDALSRAPHKDRITHIVPVAHGAAAVLVDPEGRVLSAPDYEDACCETVSAEYDQLRDAFEHTFSPNLPLGLNLGRQLFCIQRGHPMLFWRTKHILLYPQYWAWRLCGVASSEVTSLGCHSDLWRPRDARFSVLAERQGWTQLFPPRRAAADVLGTVKAEIAAHCGLPVDCKVVCGIHDSNASYLKFLIGREHSAFTVVSSGTWTVVMANGGELASLAEEKDMLANVNAFGVPVPTARYMGGREYETVAFGLDRPNLEGVSAVIRQGAVALPAFAAAGPFRGRKGALLRAEHLTGVERASLATLYAASMTSLLIESLQAQGDILIDGPLASNSLFGPMLAALTGSNVELQAGEVGGARAALFLAGKDVGRISLSRADAIEMPELRAYHASWRAQVLGHV